MALTACKQRRMSSTPAHGTHCMQAAPYEQFVTPLSCCPRPVAGCNSLAFRTSVLCRLECLLIVEDGLECLLIVEDGLECLLIVEDGFCTLLHRS